MEKFGFCCKYKANHSMSKSEAKLLEKSLNGRAITISQASKLSRKELHEKLESIMQHNIDATQQLLNYVSTLPQALQMVRISSDLLPLYTHELGSDFYKSKDIKNYLEIRFRQIGDFSKENNIRLGMHPGQFCVLNSVNESVVKNSIKEFEYHIDMARMMGFTKWHENGFNCNVHVGSKDGGVENFLKTLMRLSEEGRNLITVENDEYSFGVDECLALKDHVAIVLDVHHHWCKTGEYIQSGDPRVALIKESWRGVRPLLHYSISRKDLFPNHKGDTLLDMNQLKKDGYSISDLRAHSDDYWNPVANKWVFSFLRNFDIECECKDKNQATIKLFQEFYK